MIPSIDECVQIWEKYNFPDIKRTHVCAVLSIARVLVTHIREGNLSLSINEPLIDAACLLHDIDKNVPKLPGERHPDASVRVMKDEGFDELVGVVRRHPLHMILDVTDHPSTLEEEIVYLSDKMAKYEPIGVAKRFGLWNEEHLDPEAQNILDTTYPIVVKLSYRLCGMTGLHESEIIREASANIPSV